MATVTACSYNGSAPSDKLATFYGQGESWALMADYLVGAASQFDIRSPIALAIGALEEGGVGTNWMQLEPGTISDFQSEFWGPNNQTGQNPPSASDIEAIDSLNAAAGIWWYLQKKKYCTDVSDWQALLSMSSAYNSICGCSCPYATAYGWSSLFLAYGNDYTTVPNINYVGAYYVTGPTGTQTKYNNASCGPQNPDLEVPNFSTTRTQRVEPHGRNSNGKQIVLFTSRDDTSFVSALQANINLRNAGYTQPLVTADRDFAATSTQYRANCVVAVGASAVSDIETALTNMGLSWTSFSDFAFWEASGTYGFINAAGSTAAGTYSLTIQRLPRPLMLAGKRNALRGGSASGSPRYSPFHILLPSCPA